VFADILRRTFEYNSYEVRQVINITDVGHLVSDADDGDDKMVKALKREGKPFTLSAMREVADFYAKAFENDLKFLNCETPFKMPHASDHIAEDVEIIKKLEENGFAYKTKDGIYFDTAKFPNYGKLGNINLSGQKAGARVAVNSDKKNPADFTLWKISINDIGWDSSWGKGFPGWHIECSAMSRKYLGQPFDIHTGGIDHIPVHHNNEIAQSEGAYGTTLANYWLHSEFVNISGSKMAKAEDNFLRLQTLINKNFNPIDFRFWILGAHYRTPMNFSFEALEGAQNGYKKLTEQIAGFEKGGKPDKKYLKKFTEAINDDLNMPKTLALAFEILKDDKLDGLAKRATILEFDKVFGLGLSDLEKIEIPENISALANERENARKQKDFKKADDIRKEIELLGFELNDTQSGPIIKKK
jgi:cysteinyl-tRNA synthetase